jgi:hypothetical protein
MKPTRQNIFNGTRANDGTGDTLRDATTKINDNFARLYGDLYDSSRVTDIVDPEYVKDIIDSDHVISKVSFETQSINSFGDVDAVFASTGDLLVLDSDTWSNLSATHLDFDGLTKFDPLIRGRLWRDSDNDNVLKVSRG